MARRLLAVGCLAFLNASCATTPGKVKLESPVRLPGTASVFVRATFDSDASSLIGSFLPDDVEDDRLDESQAMRTRCSEFVKVKRIPASGETEDVFGASSSIGGKLGVQKVASIAGERKDMNAIRIKYNASEVMQADVDTRGLTECCQAEPSQCTKRFISRALAGDGRIFVATEKSNQIGLEAEGSFKNIPISGDIMYKDGVKWERTTEFRNQFFAFSFSRTLQAGSKIADDCSWARKPPSSLDGLYFVGVSEPAPSERVARDLAMREARGQVVKYLGEWLEQSSKTNQKLSGALGALGGALEDQTTVETLSTGLAKLVKDQAWCEPERVETPKGVLQVMRVLSFFPNSERSAAMKIQLTSLIDVLKSQGKLTPEKEAQLKTAIAEVK